MGDEQINLPSESFRLELYRQAWEQARHNERLRDTFTTFFALIVGATLVFTTSANLNSENWPWWFPMSLALVGLAVSIRAKTNVRRYTNLQIRIQEKEGINRWLPRCDERAKLCRIDNLYILMYGLVTLVFFLLALGVLDIPDRLPT